MTDIPFRGWIASLSDGNNAFEGTPKPGEASAWQQLLSYLRTNGTKITMLRLQRGGKTIYSMPSKMCQGYFQASEIRYQINSGKETKRQGIGSVVGDQVFINWLDDDGNVWQEVRELEGERIHTTL